MNPPSRQRLRLKEKHAAGECLRCEKKVAYQGGYYCLQHLVTVREERRQKRGCKRRYYSLSYQLEAGYNFPTTDDSHALKSYFQ